MKNLAETTVADILSQDFLSHSTVYAGENGLTNIVKWTHIVESEKFIYTLNGGELILTTGIGLDSDPDANIDFIKNLIDKKVSAICIELGNTFKDISPEIAQLSEASQIPIIIFTKAVKFVDITHNIHKYIINNQHLVLNKLYNLSKKFNSLALLPNGVLKILQELYANFNTPVYFLHNKAAPSYFPPEAKDNLEHIYPSIRHHGSDETLIQINKRFFIVSGIYNERMLSGYLCLQLDHHAKETDFMTTVLEQASLAISHIMLRNEVLEERKQFEEGEFVHRLLNKKFGEIGTLNTMLPFSYRNSRFRVMVITIENNDSMNNSFSDEGEFKMRISAFIRKICKEQNLFPILSFNENELSIISFSLGLEERDQITATYEGFSEYLTQHKDFNSLVHGSFYLGIGKSYSDYTKIPQSYIEAKRVIELDHFQITKVNLFEEAGVYEVLFEIENRDQIFNFIHTHMKDILDLEPKSRNELLITLESFLDNNGSYKLAAQQLFVVRQTLYHRMKKIREILGEDFLDSPKRLAIEFSIKAYRYLQKSIEEE
jgi:purine catabolism regulator